MDFFKILANHTKSHTEVFEEGIMENKGYEDFSLGYYF